MKKKLEAELISIAHRILKLKNRADLDVLQQETLKLYEKISVLRFVEDNFSDVKPTIGYASAEETLEEIYGIEETPVVHANEQEAKEEEARKDKKAKEKEPKAKSQKPEDESKAESQKSEEESQEETRNTQPETDEPEGDADPEQKVEEYQASEEEKEHTEEETDEEAEQPQAEESKAEEPLATSQESQEEEDPQPETTKNKQQTENSEEEPEVKIQVEKPAEDIKAMEDAAAAVYKKEDDSTLEEEEQAADAEVITIAPDDKAKVEDLGVNFEFAFERTPAPEEPQKQKEITFEDYHNYKEPEFVKKGEASEQSQSQEETRNAQPETPNGDEETRNAQPETPNAERDWRNWEPAKEEPKEEEKPQGTSFQSQSQSAEPTRNPQPGTRSLTLGLNDRIAFEKNLFGGSGEDLNRVISQLNTFDTHEHAVEFINDMVKPDYNNWQGKEEYEERFMALVEQKFS